MSGFQAVSDKLHGSSEMPWRLQGKGMSVCWGVENWGRALFSWSGSPVSMSSLSWPMRPWWSGAYIPSSSSELPCLPGSPTMIYNFLQHKCFLASGIFLVMCLVWTIFPLALCLCPTSLGMPPPISLNLVIGHLAAYTLFIALLQL